MARTLLSVTVLALLVAAAFAQDVKVNAPGTQVKTEKNEQGSKTQVNAPTTQVKTQTGEQGTYTKVDAPGTQVVSTPQGTVVTAPGNTTAVGNKDGATVSAPGTTVLTDKQAGTTSVRAPAGTKVDVTPQGTRVIAPFVNIVVPNFGGRKMLRA